MSMKLKPGYLVNLSVRERGGVTYKREDLGTKREGVHEESAWRTDREIVDVEEHAKAQEVRSKSRALIAGACVQTPFTVMVLTESFPLFTQRLEEAKGLIEAFNADAKHGQLHLHCTWGQIAESSREAVESLRNDLSYLLQELKTAAEAQDVKRMRDLSSRVTSASKMLENGEPKGKLKKAVDATRALAKATAKAIADGADRLEDDLASINLAPINAAMFEFLGGAAAQAGPVELDPQAMIFDALEAEEEPPSSDLFVDPEVLDWSKTGPLAEETYVEPEDPQETELDRIFNSAPAISDDLAMQLQDLASATPEADEDDPFAAGWTAYQDGKAEGLNPHEHGSTEWTLWGDGWGSAAQDDDPELKAFMQGGAA